MTSPEVPYRTRIDAANVAARLKLSSANPGSGELQALAGGTITAQQAQQPYFYAARVRAAESAPNAVVRLKLLREAIAINPSDSLIRLPLFRAAIADGQYRFAISSIEDAINRSYEASADGGSDPGSDPAGDSGDASDSLDQSDFGPSDQLGDEDQDDEPDYIAQQTSILPQFHLTPAQQARVAAQLALAYEKSDELPSARSYYLLAANLETDAARRSTLKAAAAGVQAKLKLRQQNAQRRPQIHIELEQDRIVKPRLSAEAAPANPAARSSQ